MSEEDCTRRPKVLNGNHERYVAVVSAPMLETRLLVGAWEHQGVNVNELFMVEMDLDTAREYGRSILAACDSAARKGRVGCK